MRFNIRTSFVLPFILLAACNDSTGSGNTGQVRVFMSAAQSAQSVSEPAFVANSMGTLSVSQVDSMFVRVTAVSALRQDSDTSESSGGWVTIQLADSGGKRINLLKLPQQGLDSISLARGELTAGTYKNIRLQFDPASATIRLKQNATVGNFDFTAGTVYPLEIPSGVIKIPAASLRVSADSLTAVNLVFDVNTSVANIVATGSGTLKISPVIHTSK